MVLLVFHVLHFDQNFYAKSLIVAVCWTDCANLAAYWQGLGCVLCTRMFPTAFKLHRLVVS